MHKFSISYFKLTYDREKEIKLDQLGCVLLREVQLICVAHVILKGEIYDSKAEMELSDFFKTCFGDLCMRFLLMKKH